MNVFKSSLWLIIMRNYRVILSLITVVRFILIRLIGILMRFRGEHRHYYVQIESISSYIAVHLFEDRQTYFACVELILTYELTDMYNIHHVINLNNVFSTRSSCGKSSEERRFWQWPTPVNGSQRLEAIRWTCPEYQQTCITAHAHNA